MKKIKYLLFLALSVVVLNSCTEDKEDFKYVTFQSETLDFPVPIAGNATKDIKVYATQVMKSDRTFQVQVVSALTTADPASYTVPASVTIPADSNEGILSVKVSDLNIGDAGKALVIELVNDEEYYEGKSIKLNVSRRCDLNDVRVNLTLDSWGSETTWELYNSANVLIGSGGPYADGLTTTVVTKFCIANGTYTFKIYDAYGDGLSATSAGKVQVVKGTATLVNIVGDFGTEASATFTLP